MSINVLDKIICGTPRSHSFEQVDALLEWLKRTPSHEDLQRIRREAYERFDERRRA